MKITTKKLRQIIREEVSKSLLAEEKITLSMDVDNKYKEVMGGDPFDYEYDEETDTFTVKALNAKGKATTGARRKRYVKAIYKAFAKGTRAYEILMGRMTSAGYAKPGMGDPEDPTPRPDEPEAEEKPEEGSEMGKVELSVLIGPVKPEPMRGFYNRYGKFIDGPLKRKSKKERIAFLFGTSDEDLIKKRMELALAVRNQVSPIVLRKINKSHPVPREAHFSFMVPTVLPLNANLLGMYLGDFGRMIEKFSEAAEKAADKRNSDLEAEFKKQDAVSSQKRRSIAYKYDKDAYDTAVQKERDMGIRSFFTVGSAPQSADYVGIA